MAASISRLAAQFTFTSPDKGCGVSIPASGSGFQPGDDLCRRGRVLPIQGPAFENSLDGLGHVQPGASQGRVEWQNAMPKQPQNKLRRFVPSQIVQNQQHAQGWQICTQ